MRDLIAEKAKLLESSISSFDMAEKGYNETSETIMNEMKTVMEWIKKEEELSKNSDLVVTKELKEQLENANSRLGTLKEEHSAEISTISQSYLSKISFLKEKEENALLQIEALKAQAASYKETVDKLRNISERETKLKDVQQVFGSSEKTKIVGNIEKKYDSSIEEYGIPPVNEEVPIFEKKTPTPVPKNKMSAVKSQTAKTVKTKPRIGTSKQEPKKRT